MRSEDLCKRLFDDDAPLTPELRRRLARATAVDAGDELADTTDLAAMLDGDGGISGAARDATLRDELEAGAQWLERSEVAPLSDHLKARAEALGGPFNQEVRQSITPRLWSRLTHGWGLAGLGAAVTAALLALVFVPEDTAKAPVTVTAQVTPPVLSPSTNSQTAKALDMAPPGGTMPRALIAEVTVPLGTDLRRALVAVADGETDQAAIASAVVEFRRTGRLPDKPEILDIEVAPGLVARLDDPALATVRAHLFFDGDLYVEE